MKRIGIILSLSVIIVLAAATSCFASGLSLVSTNPVDGDNTLQYTNVAVKMVFSENMTSAEAQAANEHRFKITNKDGDSIAYKTLYNAKKYPNQIWLQITETLTTNTQYTLKISGDVVSSAGDTLGEGETIKFATRNTKQDNNVYMILMLVMVAGMVGFTTWETRRKVKQEMEEKGEEPKVNPYKEAKKTGKSVEQIVAKTEKEKERAEKHRIKAELEDTTIDYDPASEKSDAQKVKARRSITTTGAAVPAVVVKKRKAREAAEAKAEEKAKARAQNTGKSKGSKQQQHKNKK
jgi:hypothetical protein